MKTLAHVRTLLCVIGFGASLSAQTTPNITIDAKMAASVQALDDGLKFRNNLVNAIVGGAEKPAVGLTRLRAHATPTGLKLDAEADFAFAAIDVGRRLLVASKADEAEMFFTEAEKSLDKVVRKTPDSAARDKAQYLQARAMIRANYLNKLAEGRADLEAAILLLPDDKRLRQLRNLLPADPAELLKKNSKG